MAQALFNFPQGFLWGTATAAHQVEGNNTNNTWYAWEQEPGRILNGHKSGLACDWWNGRWREDLDRAAESGQSAHRLSLEWSRIQPTPDRWDEEALDRYLEMLRGLHERNLTPLVTLHHFSDPLWLAELGGWENDAISDYFSKYVSKVVGTLKDYASLWCTINEPNVYATLGYLLGLFPPGKKSLRVAALVMLNQVRAHAAAYHAIHSIQPHARVGIALNYMSLKPAHAWSPLDRLLVGLQYRLYNEMFPRALKDRIVRLPFGRARVRAAKGTQDYLGIDYYTRNYVAFSPFDPGKLFMRRFFRPGAELSDNSFLANEPDGMFEAIEWGGRFNVPIIITENGVEDADDHLRPRYLAEHLHQVWRAINFNWPVRGYFHWTLVDNFEWERGWTQRFGLWELDVETQARRKRPSADFYAEICRENCLSSEMVARYAPAIFSVLFPN